MHVMFDRELAGKILSQILESAERILIRFEPVTSSDFFMESEENLEKLDGICMQLIVIGESLKNFDKLAGTDFLGKYSQVDWQRAKAIRDIISHHYINLDAEVVFDVCQEKIPQMIPVLKQMIADVEKGNF